MAMSDAPQNSNVEQAPCAVCPVTVLPTRVRVFVAQVDARARFLLASALRDDGHDVIEVASGSELLDRLAQDSHANRLFDQPNVIVCDLRIPRCCGLDVLVSLKLANWALPVILLSGHVDRDMYGAARRLGAVAIFNDPFDLDDLRTLVMNVSRTN
jgi:CheY-like chemotaxis protein